MNLFHNMTTVGIYTMIAVVVLLAYGARTNPFRIGGLFVREMAVNRKYLFHFAALMLILFCNKLELSIEANMSGTHDFTSLFQSIEGHFVANLQHTFHNDILTAVLAVMYVVVFQALLIASVGIYTYQEKSRRMYYAICYAIMVNYLVAIPFYLFFPVNEVWAHDSSVRFLMLDVFPNFETEYRSLSGINNCFPSLHTSISVTLAVLAIRSGNKRWAWLCSISAVMIIFAIFYLGIHWLIDMGGGLILGVFASTVGMRLSALNMSLRSRRPNHSLKGTPANISFAHDDAK
ncbi:phosphatase PAP2 family protein [Paenibacillus sp. sptzw28]|uniref:phosphatase PAP2 family protein n=1 Tax=Paenibacillus sp. sptzw28 TaxID=715179 RepID=UPI001C6E2E11|nr:phosphatase PAP2 family protein [Paenibacillus sp. sptzw28]QYR23409.1 phosphatase PAP2 family protein [Paenibacillus sp. sptzw28]